MEIRLEINSDIEFGLNRLVEQHGRNREYYVAQLVQTGIRNLEHAYRAENNLDSRDVMSRYALED